MRVKGCEAQRCAWDPSLESDNSKGVCDGRTTPFRAAERLKIRGFPSRSDLGERSKTDCVAVEYRADEEGVSSERR